MYIREGDRTRRMIATSNSYESRYGNDVIDAMTYRPCLLLFSSY